MSYGDQYGQPQYGQQQYGQQDAVPPGYPPQQPPGFPPPGYQQQQPGYPPYGYPMQPPGYGPPPGAKPNSHLVMAIFALLCFWPLGIAAIVKAAKVDGAWSRGEVWLAQDSSAKAKKYSIICFVVAAVVIVLEIAFFAAFASHVSSGSSYSTP